MPNKKINQLDSRVLSATDLVLIGDPTTGTSYKSLVSGLGLVYVPYTGASSNVNLGEYELKAGRLTLDTTPTGTAGVGTTRWNDTIGSSETTLKGGNVILKNGVDLVARVVNKVTPNATLTKANYQAVKISGAQGQRLAVALAQANNDANSADTIGLVIETINANQEGFIMTMGNLEGINTTGSLQGETWADGDVLYLSPTTAGAITKVKPTGATGHIVVIGYVEYAHAINGKIYVKVMNGWELEELHDVAISTPANNEALIYESATSLWKNKTIASALGYTPVPTTRTLTINGTAYDLSADRSWTVSSANIYTADGTLTGNRTVNLAGYNLAFKNAASTYGIYFSADSSIPRIDFLANGSFIGQISNTTTDVRIANNLLSTGGIIFDTQIVSGTTSTRMKLTNAGRLLLGTTTESTFLLDVNGTARVSGGLRIGDTALGQLITLTQYGNYGIALQAATLEFTVPTGISNKFLFGSGTSGSLSTYLTVRSDSILSPSPITITNNYFSVDNISNWANPTVSGGTGLQFAYYKDSSNNYGQGISALSGGKYDIWYQTGATNGGGFRWYQGTTEIFRASSSRNILIGTSTDVASAKIVVESTTQGFLPPRMTTTQKNAIGTPAAGLQVYDTTLNQMSYYNGTNWVNF